MSSPSAESIHRALLDAAPLTVPRWRPLRAEWSRELAAATPATVFRLAESLLTTEPWGRLTAYELIANHAGCRGALTIPLVRRLARGLGDWVGVDTFGCYVAGPAWRDGVLPTSLIEEWADSPDRWQRRLALVCTVPLNVRARGGTGDAKRTLAMCQRLAADRDDMVVKAVSWALRSLIAWDADAVAAFLQQSERILAPRVLREVRTKLHTGRKTRRASRAE